ncbi:hypothetical protein ACFWM7_10985 [Streptomyces sp. NPDC058375]|uniref:hypothetical protein n=1 Tax=Streptomyces sp. NPDC058375 TaxID=3346467 RepID=UPI0036488818
MIIIPAATVAVLVVDGRAFETEPPDLPDNPCPTSASSASSELGRYPTDFTDEAQPYAGPGPHLITTDAGTIDARLPSDWKVAPRQDRRISELVLCEYREDRGVAVDDCRYAGGFSVTLKELRATYRLYEAKTSKLVTGFHVDGRGGCPRSVRYPEGERPPLTLPQSIDESDVIAKLRPYVEGSGT